MLRLRIFLDFVAVGLLIACLAYWSFGNLWHEAIGTVFFVLLIAHNVFNRRWYGALPRNRRSAGKMINTLVILCLAVSMLVMLVTSLLISRDLFSFMALSGAFSVCEIHMFVAYWALMFMGIHLGTRWSVVMNTCSSASGGGWNPIVVWALRALAVVITLKGLHATFEMELGSKLMWQYSLDMWDFTAETPRFFLNYMTIVGLYAAVTYYIQKMFQVRRRRRQAT